MLWSFSSSADIGPPGLSDIPRILLGQRRMKRGGLGGSAGFLSRRNLNRQTGFGVAAAVREPVIQTSMRRSAMSKEDHGHAKHARLLELEAMVRDGRIDTLVVAITDMQG